MKNIYDVLIGPRLTEKANMMHGKQKRVGKTVGTTNDWKKAYVTLSEGAINFTDEL